MMHGSLKNIAALFSEEESGKIRLYAAQNRYPVFDFAYRPAYCDRCGGIVSAPVLELTDGAEEYIGFCDRCGEKMDSAAIIEDIGEMPCPACGSMSLQTEETGLWD